MAVKDEYESKTFNDKEFSADEVSQMSGGACAMTPKITCPHCGKNIDFMIYKEHVANCGKK